MTWFIYILFIRAYFTRLYNMYCVDFPMNINNGLFFQYKNKLRKYNVFIIIYMNDGSVELKINGFEYQ